MNSCFADTSYFIALLSPADANHRAARAMAEELRLQVVTSEYVIVEVGNFFRAGPARSRFGTFMSAVASDAGTHIVAASSSILSAAAELFIKRTDKTWSLTDCTSFVIMQDRGITEELTADRHFEQAGFRALLRSEPA